LLSFIGKEGKQRIGWKIGRGCRRRRRIISGRR
jgi:hypothetical protein